MNKTQVAVIGGGPGGYVAAFKAADLGLQVTLIDLEEKPGGVCLFRGCIPSKALLHVARLLNEAKEASRWGVEFAEPRIDLDRLRAWKDEVVGKMTGGLGQLARARKLDYIQGRARFTDSNTLRIDQVGGDQMDLQFEHAILATGSRPAALPNLDPDHPRIMDSTSALELADIPRNLLVVGGGYIGLELGTVYASLGSQVSVVELASGLLLGADRDLVKPLSTRLDDLFEHIALDTKIAQIEDDSQGLAVQFEASDGSTSTQTFEKILVAVGRRPNTEDLGLENTKVQLDERGFVHIDPQRRTADPSIFAIGDISAIAAEAKLAHKASHEGAVAAEAIAGHKVAFEPNAIPAVVFTDPEIAWCGLTETQAAAEQRPIEVARFPWAASGRATTQDRNDGLTKLIIDPQSERVLGVGIVGAGAGELIAEGVLAVEMAALAKDIKLSIHPHPTLSETVMEAGEVFFGESPHLYAPKKK
ncbi:MAG: dihydrolipoyl dehydrogenase [Candidatus Latescibacteria bacterium]|nr:dihydrolipoyl dehydrogenase [Candidatus Latescibacterota bacterium]